MAFLFIDTTYDITLGLLDQSLEWVSFETHVGQKVSHVIQMQTHVLLKSQGLSLRDLEGVITVAGPGFYTGLRLSEGFADVLSFSGLKHYSFLSYSIPTLAGLHSGVWMTKAYRGEYFFHHWNSTSHKNELISTKELEGYVSGLADSEFYIHSDSALDETSRKSIKKSITTLELLKRYPQKIFEKIVKNGSRIDSFYFRAPEDEFKVSL